MVNDPNATSPQRNSYAASAGTAAVDGSPIIANPLRLNLNVRGSGSFSVVLDFHGGDTLARISTTGNRAGALGISCPVPNTPNGTFCPLNTSQFAQDGAQIRVRLPRGTTVYKSAARNLKASSTAGAPKLPQNPAAITGFTAKTLAQPATAAEAGRSCAISLRVSNNKGTVTSPAVDLTVKAPDNFVTADAGGALPGPLPEILGQHERDPHAHLGLELGTHRLGWCGLAGRCG